jgi:hypothetical protein
MGNRGLAPAHRRWGVSITGVEGINDGMTPD